MSVATQLPVRSTAPQARLARRRRDRPQGLGVPTSARPVSGTTLRTSWADSPWAVPGSTAVQLRGPRSAAVQGRRAARLTRRGQVVVVLIALALLLGLGFTLGRVGASHAAGVSGAVTTTVVQPGESLWSIAARVAPNSDTRIVVARIETANHLVDGNVQVGERLVLPS